MRGYGVVDRLEGSKSWVANLGSQPAWAASNVRRCRHECDGGRPGLGEKADWWARGQMDCHADWLRLRRTRLQTFSRILLTCRG